MHPVLKRLLHKDLQHLVPSDLNREGSLGGTDLPIICGVNQYNNAYQLYQKKLGLAPPTEMNDKMEWGLRNERAIIEKFDDDHPEFQVYRPKVDYPGVLLLPGPKVWHYGDVLFNAHASPDSIGKDSDGNLFIIEAKTTDKWAAKAWGDSGSRIFPLMHRYQVQWYMWICQVEYAYISVLIGGNDYREYRIEYNQELVDTLVQKAKVFHEAVVNRTPPIPTEPADMKNYLLETRDDDYSDEFVKPTDDHLVLVKELKKINGQVEKLATKKENIHNKLKEYIKDNGVKGIQCPEWKATWSTGESTRIPSYQKYSKELEGGWTVEALQEVRDKHTVTTVKDSMRVTFPGKKKGGKK